jgi:hypothetical protein
VLLHRRWKRKKKRRKRRKRRRRRKKRKSKEDSTYEFSSFLRPLCNIPKGIQCYYSPCRLTHAIKRTDVLQLGSEDAMYIEQEHLDALPLITKKLYEILPLLVLIAMRSIKQVTGCAFL